MYIGRKYIYIIFIFLLLANLFCIFENNWILSVNSMCLFCDFIAI